MKESAIIVEKLTKVFQSRRGKPPFKAVDDISFTVPRGEIFGCLGPNGAGKTTTIRIVLGLLRPSAGKVRALGFELPGAAKALHSRTGYVSQRFTLYDDLSAAENLRFYGRVYGLAGRQLRARFDSMISLAGLSGMENELVQNLPGGSRQRLALSCAIIHDPELIFLDEPTAGLSPKAAVDIMKRLKTFAQEQKNSSILMVEHRLELLDWIDSAFVLIQGKIKAETKDTSLFLDSKWLAEHYF